MSNSYDRQWPSDADMDRIWDSTQTAITKQAKTAHRRKVTLIAGSGALALGITAGAIIIPATQTQLDSTARCYSDQSTESQYSDVALADGQAELNQSSAITNCGAAWAYGNITLGQVHITDNQQPIAAAPPLGVCLQPNDILAVFPLTSAAGTVLTPEELCQKLSLRAATK
ncbi:MULTISPECIES: hypothetical protein [Micrococcaceae]|uniref:hypothetical protein n=1 Tax=Micrococcaceae TaxID=1268 RepID=UPI000CE2C019|nr:hypothetical protein [Arthrobacter sp. N199823]